MSISIMSSAKRVIFFVSDSTGITVKTLGESLLAQFDTIKTHQKIIPFVNNHHAVHAAVDVINAAAKEYPYRPIVFATITNAELRDILAASQCMFVDLFGAFIEPLEREFETKSNHAVGRSQAIQKANGTYDTRIDAINFTLQHDDGACIERYKEADVILVGASRSGKTPTCVYLAIQFGISAANYPLTDEDVEGMKLPDILTPYRHKLFGLTIRPERLHQIRQGRRPNSRYSSLRQCELEVQKIEALYRKIGLSYIDTTSTSVEEIASRLLMTTNLNRFCKV
jgi:regulator of PEP synthase PpsR (kinase-PPPase family)